MANDNRSPAGQLKNGILDLRLGLSSGVWYPEDEGGGHRDAFAEEGHAPRSAGPLIRVTQGRQIHLSIRNTLPLEAKIYGLYRHRGDSKDKLRAQRQEREYRTYRNFCIVLASFAPFRNSHTLSFKFL